MPAASERQDRLGRGRSRLRGLALSRAGRVLLRFGLLGRGLVFLLVAGLAIQVALGVGFEEPDRPEEEASAAGALAAVSGTPVGAVSLVALAVAAFAFALLMLADATLGHRTEPPRQRWGNRGLSAVGVLIYGVLGWQALQTGLLGDDPAEGDTSEALTARVLQLPGGRVLVGVAVVVLVVVGAGLLRRVAKPTMLSQLRTEEMGRGTRRLLSGLARAGSAARAALAWLAAGFLLRAVLQGDPQEAAGVDETLRQVADATYGPWLLGILALGLACWGAYGVLEVRWRQLAGEEGEDVPAPHDGDR